MGALGIPSTPGIWSTGADLASHAKGGQVRAHGWRFEGFAGDLVRLSDLQMQAFSFGVLLCTLACRSNEEHML